MYAKMDARSARLAIFGLRPLAVAIAAAVLCSTGAYAAQGQSQGSSQGNSSQDNAAAQSNAQQGSQAQAASGRHQSAQNQAGQGGSTQQQSASASSTLPDEYKATNWIGKTVRNNEGQKLGKVKDLVIDDLGVVRFVVMQTNSQSGKQGKLVAVPMGQFQFPLTAHSYLVFDTEQTKLQNAPSFAANQWPNLGSPALSGLIITYWVPVGGQQGAGGQQAANQGPGGQQPSGFGGTPSSSSFTFLPQGEAQLFQRLDRNNDGVIDQQEARANPQISNNFNRIDTYGNGRISPSEFAAFEAEQQGLQGQQPSMQPGANRGMGGQNTGQQNMGIRGGGQSGVTPQGAPAYR